MFIDNKKQLEQAMRLLEIAKKINEQLSDMAKTNDRLLAEAKAQIDDYHARKRLRLTN